jgi:hypothetical protein
MEKIKPTHLKTSTCSGGATFLPSNTHGKSRSSKNIDQVMKMLETTKNKLMSKTSSKDAKAKNNHTLGKKLRFSTMVSTTCNYILKLKMSFPIVKCFFQLKVTFSTAYQNS